MPNRSGRRKQRASSNRPVTCPLPEAGYLSVLSARLGVFPGKLMRRAFLVLLLPVQARFARPCALQFVADAEPKPAEALRFQFNHIPVHEAGQATVVGAGC